MYRAARWGHSAGAVEQHHSWPENCRQIEPASKTHLSRDRRRVFFRGYISHRHRDRALSNGARDVENNLSPPVLRRRRVAEIENRIFGHRADTILLDDAALSRDRDRLALDSSIADGAMAFPAEPKRRANPNGGVNFAPPKKISVGSPQTRCAGSAGRVKFVSETDIAEKPRITLVPGLSK